MAHVEKHSLVLLSEALSSGRATASEDRVGFVHRAAWAIDGATQIDDGSFVPAVSEGTWIAEIADGVLRRALARGGSESGRRLIWEANGALPCKHELVTGIYRGKSTGDFGCRVN